MKKIFQSSKNNRQDISRPKNWFNIKLTIFFALIYIVTFTIDRLYFNTIVTIDFLIGLGGLLLIFLFLHRIQYIYYTGVVLFLFVAQFIGAMLDVYTIFPLYDVVLHLTSGILLAFMGQYIFSLLTKNKNHNTPMVIMILFCFMFSVSGAALWEIWEFSGDLIIKINAQQNLFDTMTDLIAGSSGAIIGVSLIYLLMDKLKLSNNIKDSNK